MLVEFLNNRLTFKKNDSFEVNTPAEATKVNSNHGKSRKINKGKIEKKKKKLYRTLRYYKKIEANATIVPCNRTKTFRLSESHARVFSA